MGKGKGGIDCHGVVVGVAWISGESSKFANLPEPFRKGGGGVWWGLVYSSVEWVLQRRVLVSTEYAVCTPTKGKVRLQLTRFQKTRKSMGLKISAV